MPYTRLYYHIIWTTKNRLPILTPQFEISLFQYFKLKAKELESTILEINGYLDHIHILIQIPPKYSVSEVIQRLKGATSHKFPELYWQRGFGALTVSERNLSAAIEYVRKQKDHHNHNNTISKLERFDDEDAKMNHIINDNVAIYDLDSETDF